MSEGCHREELGLLLLNQLTRALSQDVSTIEGFEGKDDAWAEGLEGRQQDCMTKDVSETGEVDWLRWAESFIDVTLLLVLLTVIHEMVDGLDWRPVTRTDFSSGNREAVKVLKVEGMPRQNLGSYEAWWHFLLKLLGIVDWR